LSGAKRKQREAACRQTGGSAHSTARCWRAYFIPTWTIIAFQIMISPIHALYERPSISVALFISDYLQPGRNRDCSLRHGCWRWGRMTVVAFFALFLVFITTRPRSARAAAAMRRSAWRSASAA